MTTRPILLALLVLAMLPWGALTATAAAKATVVGGPVSAHTVEAVDHAPAQGDFAVVYDAGAQPVPHRCRMAIVSGLSCGPDGLISDADTLPDGRLVLLLAAPDRGLFRSGQRPRGPLDPPRFR